VASLKRCPHTNFSTRAAAGRDDSFFFALKARFNLEQQSPAGKLHNQREGFVEAGGF
jgi:hypothetical protein